MKIKLLQPFQGLKEGREWNCPVASVARKLIEEGKALAIEECDLHLNPTDAAGGTPNAAAGEKPKRKSGRKAPPAPAADDAAPSPESPAIAPATENTAPPAPEIVSRPKRQRKPRK